MRFFRIAMRVEDLKHNDDIMNSLLNSNARSGPFDGGCLVFAKALQLALDTGIVVRMESNVNGTAQAEHYGLMLDDGTILDADGPASGPGEWIRRFSRNEMLDVPLVVVPGVKADADAPDDPRAVKELAQIMRRLLGGVAKSKKRSSWTGTVYHGGADVERLDPEITNWYRRAQEEDEYMQALEAGDMDTAARLVYQAAQKAGYGIGPVFHGGRFDKSRHRNFFVGDEGFIFFAPEETAQWYARQDEDADVTAVYLREDEYLEISEMEWLHDRLEDGTPLMEASEPYSGVKIVITQNSDDPAWGPGPVYGVSDLSCIKSAAPVTLDASNRPIPLEKRFDESNPSMMY